MEQAGIYKRYQAVTFESIERRGLPGNDSIQSNYHFAKGYAANMEQNVKRGRGLILAGGYGTMKTTVAVAILRDWLDKGHSGLIVPMCSLMDNLYTMKVLNRDEWAKYEQRIRRISLLILDDLGGEETDQKWILSKIDSIITERYNKMLPTIITTNMNTKELTGTYSARVIDRLKNTADILVFTGSSQRRHLWAEEGLQP